MSRILFISEYMAPPYDEGIKKIVIELFNELTKKHHVKAISRYAFQNNNIITINTNALFLSRRIKSAIKSNNPDVIIYLPFASATFASYLRLYILRLLSGRNVRRIIIALQPKPLTSFKTFIVRFIKPEYALTPSPQLHAFWNRLKVENTLVPLMTNLEIFKPLVNIEEKKKLRRKYKLPENKYIISHMGHLNEGRNLKSLIPLQDSGYQVVIIGSSSTPLDSIGPESIKNELLRKGIIIIDKYLPEVFEIYHLSDAYVFPVLEKNSSIGMPLSILEARACGIPVISTDFGSVKRFLNSDHGNIYYSEPEKFNETIKELFNDSEIDRKITSVRNINEVLLTCIENYIHKQ